MTTSYRYDSVGNLLTQATSGASKIAFSYAYNAPDQLTEYVGYDGYQQAFVYAANGMRLSKNEAGDANRSTLEELLRGKIAGLPEIVEPTQSQTNEDEADVPAELEWTTTAYAYGLERIAAYNKNGVTRYVYDGRRSVAQTVNAPVASEAVSSTLPDVSVKVQTYDAYEWHQRNSDKEIAYGTQLPKAN